MSILPKDLRTIPKENIEQVHAVILRMLKIVDIICLENGIDYWLDYGTLLGAIRHKSFIPWDIEADIGMLRPDFESFKQIIISELPADMFFQNTETDQKYEEFACSIEGKLRDRYSNYVNFLEKFPLCGSHNGIQIDIFVYDLDKKDEELILSNAFERQLTKTKSYFRKEELKYLIKRKFDKYVFPLPIGYDSYLRRNYGDYLQFPSLSEQTLIHVDVFNSCKHPASLTW